MKLAMICVVLVGFSTSSVARADEPDSRGFSVDFSQCTEFAGVGPVDFGRASSLVQPAFTTLQAGSAAAIVVRATSCASARVDGGGGVPTIISQIGIEIVPPDGTG